MYTIIQFRLESKSLLASKEVFARRSRELAD